MSTPPQKVVHLTSVHQPFDIRIFHKACKTAVAAGYQVVVIAPHGHDEVVDGVRIRAVTPTTSRRDRMTRTLWRIFRAARSEQAQLYQFHDPELLPVALLLKLTGRHVIYDVHEDLPRDILKKDWISARLRHFLAKGAGAVEGVSGHILDGVVAATPTIAHRFPDRRTVTVHNYPILREFTATEAGSYDDREPTVVYTGGLTCQRGVREMIQSVALVPAPLGAKLVLAGIFETPALEAETRAMPEWRNVDFLGWQSRAEVGRLLGRSRVGIVLLHPTQAYIESLPIKLFEYMAAGIPVVASDFPGWRRIIDGAGCGLLVDPLNPAVIAAAVQWLLEHPAEAEAMGQRGRAAAETRYNWDSEGKTLTDFYGKLLG